MKHIIYIASPHTHQIHVVKINENQTIEMIQVLNTPGQVQPMIIHPNKKILYVGVRPEPKIISFYIEHDGYLNKQEEFKIPSYSTHLNINRIGTILYSVSYNDNSLNIIKINNMGYCISLLQILEKLMGCHSSYIEIPNSRLWIPCLKEDCIKLYKINTSTGKLDENSLQRIKTQPLSGPRHMVFHNSYNYAYLINELDSTVNVITINSSRSNNLPRITQTISIFPQNNNYINNNTNYCWAADIHISPNNHWIYCSERRANIISYLAILNNKKLQFKGYQSTEIQPRGFAIDDQGQYLVVAGQKSNFTSIYNIKRNGSLKILSRFPTGKGPMWITILTLK